uniref:Uncharacterized protein n=1 Tax=Fagus sylvatica TaxID=28930 RepID=A0A2N9FUU3_FAGSY
MGGQMQQSNAAAAALYDGGGPLHNAVPAGGGGSDAGGDAVMARWLQSAGLQHLASPLASTGIDHRLLPNLLMQVVVLGGSGFVGLATSKAAVSKGIEVISLCRVLGRSASSFKYGPYIVTSLLAETTILWEPTLEAKALAAQKLLLNV